MKGLKRLMNRRALFLIAVVGVTVILGGCDERRATTRRTTLGVKRSTAKVRPESVKQAPAKRATATKRAQTAVQPSYSTTVKRRQTLKSD
jgi:hypothetical protein